MSGIKYNDGDDAPHTFEEEAGAGGTTRPVHGLAAGIVAIFTAIKTAVEATLDVADSVVAGKIDTLIGHVDGVEGSLSSILTAVGTTLAGYLDGVEGKLDTLHTDLTTTLAGYVDGLEGYVDGIETKLDTLHTDLGTTLAGYLDGLEGYVDGIEGKLDTVHADIAPPSAGFYGAGTVGTTAAQIDSGTSHALTRGARIHNVHATQLLYVGLSNAVTDSNGVRVLPGDSVPVAIDNLNKIWLYGSAATTSYRYLGV